MQKNNQHRTPELRKEFKDEVSLIERLDTSMKEIEHNPHISKKTKETLEEVVSRYKSIKQPSDDQA